MTVYKKGKIFFSLHKTKMKIKVKKCKFCGASYEKKKSLECIFLINLFIP